MSRRRLGQISYILLKTLSTSKAKNQCCVQIDSVHLYEGNLENLPELTVKPETHAQKQLFSLRKATLASSNRDKVSERPTVRFSAESNFIHKMAASAVLHGLDGTCTILCGVAEAFSVETSFAQKGLAEPLHGTSEYVPRHCTTKVCDSLYQPPSGGGRDCWSSPFHP